MSLAFIGLILFSCQKEEFDPRESFTKIYDSFRSDEEFDPIDIVATETGYLMIAGQKLNNSDFAGVQIIRLDQEGNYVESRDYSDNYVIPAGNLINIDSSYYFFAMEPASLRAVLFKTTTNLTEPEIIQTNGLYYPLAAAKTGSDRLLMLSYNPESQESVISEMDTTGTLTPGRIRGYSIGAGNDVEATIYNHYTDPERSALPFFCGELADGQVYFNGVFNYSMSLVFSNFGENPTGVVQGQNMNGGLAAALPVTGNSFAVFGYQFNDNFIQPLAAIDQNGVSSSVNLLSTTISEFKSRTPARIKKYIIGTTEYVIFAAETENRQVALYFYEAVSGELRGIHKIGYLNPYTLAAISVDEANNLIVMGTTYLSGRFERIYVTKIPAKDVQKIIE